MVGPPQAAQLGDGRLHLPGPRRRAPRSRAPGSAGWSKGIGVSSGSRPRTRHAPRWIRPHVKGPEVKPLTARETINVWRR